MQQDRNRPAGRRPGRFKRLQLNKRLTPQECQALWLVLSLFLLGLAVRWFRLAHGR